MDLALLLDGEIRDLAKKSGLAGVDSLARPDLVLQLRAMDIGKSGMPALVSSISALSSTITALTVEMVSLREDRDREVREMKATIDGLVAKMIHLEEGGSPNLIAQSTTPSTTYSSVASSGSTGAGVRETVTRTRTPPNAHSTNRTRTSQTSTHVHQTSSRTETPPAAPTRSTLATTSTSENTGSSSDGWAEVVRRRVTSRYVKPVAPANPNILTGVEKVAKSVFYVGNVHMECSANAITDWCKDREVEVLNCSISESRTFGTAYARLTVLATDEGKILSAGFWPATISHTVRKWRFADGTNVTERGGDSSSS